MQAPDKRFFISLLSTPDNKQTDNGYEIDLGKSLNNQLILYPQYFGSGKCFIDTNLSDGDDDADLECNKLSTIEVKTLSSAVYYKIRYENSKQMTSKIIKVNLLDNQTIVPDNYKEIAENIGKLVEKYSNKEDYLKLVDILQRLGQNLGDKEKTTEYLIDLDNEIKKTAYPKETKAEVQEIMDGLTNAGFRATQGLSEYERTKADILAYANPSLEPKITTLFDKLENTSDKAEQYAQLSEVLRLYGIDVTNGNIEE